MQTTCPERPDRARPRVAPRPGRRARRLALWPLALLALAPCGCAALTNPVADGIPVRRLPAEFFPTPQEELKTIPLTWLRQPPPDVYRLDKGDVVGVYIDGVLGEKGQPPPIRYSELLTNLPPALGYPIPVDADGRLPLPLIDPVPVKGLSVMEAREAIRKAYLSPKEIIKPDVSRVLVSLIRPRQYRVQVVRQDAASGTPVAVGGIISGLRRNSGAAIDLPAYENDVLNALNRTGGLPGFEAINEVIIERGGSRGTAGLPGGPGCPPDGPFAAGAGNPQVLRIPLRLPPGQPRPFRPEDIILKEGDVVFIEGRDTEVFYTGGLMLARQFVLPRDYDLRVVDAVALAGGPLVNGGTTQNNLSGAIIASGLGGPSPSSLTVVRRTQKYGLVKIRVDLNRALREPRENIIVQPGDVLILQETVGEAITRYVTTVLRFNFLGTIIRRTDLTGTATLNVP
jgi:protein involved in polysaccharide export with SLBB domain